MSRGFVPTTGTLAGTGDLTAPGEGRRQRQQPPSASECGGEIPLSLPDGGKKGAGFGKEVASRTGKRSPSSREETPGSFRRIL